MSPTNTDSPSEEPRSPLDDLVPFDEYQRRNQRLFPSVESVRWYVRMHRKQLEECEALVRILNRLYLNSERADRFVLTVGQLDARRQGDL